MRKTLALAIIVLMMGIVFLGGQNQKYSLAIRAAPTPEKITFAIYQGEGTDIEKYNVLMDVIEGKGFNLKNISELTMSNLENVSVLLLLGTSDFSSSDIEVIINYIVFGGGNILYLTPENTTNAVEDLLGIFGLEVIPGAKDNVSYYKNETNIVLNNTWPNDTKIFDGINSVLVPSAGGFNITNDCKIPELYNLSDTFKTEDNNELPIVRRYPLLWGANTTQIEYAKDKYIFGKDVIFGLAYEFWWGSRILFISTPHIFVDRYIYAPGYDNLGFLRNIVMWLGQQLYSVDIKLKDYTPNEMPILLDKKPVFSANYEITVNDVASEPQDSEEPVEIYVGIEFLGEFNHVKRANIKDSEFQPNESMMVYDITTEYKLYELYNRSVVIYLRVLVIGKYYGYVWGPQLRIELLKPKATLAFFDPILIIPALIIIANFIALILIYPFARKYKKKAKDLKEKLDAQIAKE